MSLMIWFRKHNRKIMAFVVIALMIVFTIDPVMNYLSSQRAGGKNLVAYYNQNKKITSEDLGWAQKQLEMLNFLGASAFLRPQDPQQAPIQDLRMVLLGELLLAERGTAADTLSRIKQIARTGNYPVSESQINDIYARSYPADIYWFLLVKEAQAAGVRIPPETAKTQLESIIPRIHQDTTYSQFVNFLVKQKQLSEEQMLDTFAELMSVIEYSKMICSIQDLTAQQVLVETNLNQERLDANYVQFAAKTFVSESKLPGKEKIDEQFNKYKGYFAGDISEDNPYGFGYKLPDRVQFEYIAVHLDDIAATVPRLTAQETEDYYQQHLSQRPIAYTASSDPNDPNSPITLKTRSYAEVASYLSRTLYQERVDSKAEQILQDAKSITEANLTGLEDEQNRLTGEQIKQQAIDYAKVTPELIEKYKVNVYSGKTGLLNAIDIQADKNLGYMYLEGGAFANIGLVRLAFAVEPLKISRLGPFDVKPPRLYENIGPLRDAREQMQGLSGKIMMLARIIRAEKAAEPESVNQKSDKRTIQLDQNSPANLDSNSIAELVIEDLKQLAAMDKAKEKAEQFAKLAAKDGWKTATSRFNELYAADKNKNDANVAPTFELKTRTNVQRISDTEIENLKVRLEGDPLARTMLNRTKTEKTLVDKLYALMPEDSNSLSLTFAGTIIEFKPGFSCYCIESLTIHRLFQDAFDKDKAMDIMRDDFDNSQALTFEQYNPENIVKRMNFRLVRERQAAGASGEPNEPNEPNTPNNPVQ